MLFAIEGIDGSGKGTQTRLLVERLRRRGHSVATLSFPRYGETRSSRLIAQYLNGELGRLEEISPYRAAAMFALDRLESRAYLNGLLQERDIVVADRYVASNLAYQGARASDAQRGRVLKWIYNLEYEINQLPKPSATFYLDVPPAVASNHVAKKGERSYTSKSHDLHERDSGLQGQVQFGYRHLTEGGYLGGESHAVYCANEDGTVATVAEVREELWSVVLPYLDDGVD